MAVISIPTSKLALRRAGLRVSLMQVWSSQPNAVRVSLRHFDEPSSPDQNSLLKIVAIVLP